MLSIALAATASSVDEGGHILQILWGSDPVVKLTFIILVGFSIGCWAIIFYKSKELRRWKIGSLQFAEIFWKTSNLEELARRTDDNPLANIFRRGLVDLFRKKKGDSEHVHGPSSADLVRRRVERATEDEVERIERYLPFLATTGSFTPFIGLFGTVWGILTAFWKIGKAGSSSLAVVGPYLAEALIATAMGLAAAIPAAIFYNYFVRKTRTYTRQVENFSEDLLTRVEREYFR
ncbi:MAG: MotA/TolQ/ExbB proton channel family protein [Deltaproteobacteria bacterium]|nr:MotA/TolQ/ExbB proton channel family protein [Deltaproteobacteria bacterium]